MMLSKVKKIIKLKYRIGTSDTCYFLDTELPYREDIKKFHFERSDVASSLKKLYDLKIDTDNVTYLYSHCNYLNFDDSLPREVILKIDNKPVRDAVERKLKILYLLDSSIRENDLRLEYIKEVSVRDLYNSVLDDIKLKKDKYLNTYNKVFDEKIEIRVTEKF